MRKSITAFGLSAIMVMSLAAAASAGPAYGRIIKERCGMPYGQLVAAVKSGRVEHPPITVRGAKVFVTSGLIDVHCPVTEG